MAKKKAKPRRKKTKARAKSKSPSIVADLKAQKRNLFKALVATQQELADIRSN